MLAARKIPLFELIAFAAAMLVGVGLRISNLDQIGIQHFDEGVYSSNIWFAATPDGHYPMSHLYAPGLLPAAIEWCQVFLGPTSVASILPSIVTGCLSIVGVWWVLRKWYGPDAALLGAWMVALSNFHIAYSQMALTDVPMGFF